MAKPNYRNLWDKLISDICWELVQLEKLPPKAATVEDMWVKHTLWNVLRKMCALHKLPPELQKPKELTRPLFEEKQDGSHK